MADNVITKRLSTRDKKLKQQLQLSPDELAREVMIEQSPENLRELQRAIESVPEGIVRGGLNRKEILRKELLDISNMMEPVNLGIGTMNNTNTLAKPISNSPLDQIRDFLTNMWSK